MSSSESSSSSSGRRTRKRKRTADSNSKPVPVYPPRIVANLLLGLFCRSLPTQPPAGGCRLERLSEDGQSVLVSERFKARFDLNSLHALAYRNPEAFRLLAYDGEQLFEQDLKDVDLSNRHAVRLSPKAGLPPPSPPDKKRKNTAGSKSVGKFRPLQEQFALRVLSAQLPEEPPTGGHPLQRFLNEDGQFVLDSSRLQRQLDYSALLKMADTDLDNLLLLAYDAGINPYWPYKYFAMPKNTNASDEIWEACQKKRKTRPELYVDAPPFPLKRDTRHWTVADFFRVAASYAVPVVHLSKWADQHGNGHPPAPTSSSSNSSPDSPSPSSLDSSSSSSSSSSSNSSNSSINFLNVIADNFPSSTEWLSNAHSYSSHSSPSLFGCYGTPGGWASPDSPASWLGPDHHDQVTHTSTDASPPFSDQTKEDYDSHSFNTPPTPSLASHRTINSPPTTFLSDWVHVEPYFDSTIGMLSPNPSSLDHPPW